MKIFICLRRHDAMRKARDWFGAKSNYTVLDEITTWARLQEAQWGECFVMVEIDAPGTPDIKAKNVDCVIAFSDRVAVIEVKNHRRFRSAQASLVKSLRQCCDSLDLVSAHLAGVVHDQAIRPFLFIPELTSNEIGQLTAQQLSTSSLSHPTIGGGARCRAKPLMPNGHPLYLAQALRSRMAGVVDSDSRRFSRGAQAALLQLVEPTDLHEFSALDRAVETLQRYAGTPSIIRLGEGYIRGLRPKELEQVHDRLDAATVVEVSGAPGVGKSDFIREALEEVFSTATQQMPLAVIDVKTSHTLDALCRSLLSFLDQDPDDFANEQSLIDRLIRTKSVIWIESYDTAARAVVVRLIEILSTGRDCQCRLIVESPDIRLSENQELVPESQRIKLLPLDHRGILRVLRRIEQGHPDHSLPAVASMSRGNPRLAITHWKSGRLNPVPDWLASNFLWLERAFSDPTDRAVCSLVVALIDDSPVPLSPVVLRSTACAAFRGLLPSTVKTAVNQVLGILSASQMLDLHFHRGSNYRVLGNSDELLKAARVERLDPSLAEYVTRQTDVDLLRAWNEHFRIVLKANEDQLAHAKVLLGLLQHEIMPWFSSAFRQGNMRLRDIISWLDRRILERDRLVTSTDELYLERALRVARAVERRSSIAIAEELGAPPQDSRWSKYAYNLLAAVTASHEQGPINVDTVLDGDDLDVAAEAVCWRYCLASRTDLDLTQHEQVKDWRQENLRSWLVFKDLIAVAHRLSPAVRLLVYHYTLMCATFCGEQCLEQSGIRSFLNDICKDMGTLAVTENIYYLYSAEAFFRGLLEGATPEPFDPLDGGASAVNWYARWSAST